MNKNLLILNSNQLAYLAGLIDGDGIINGQIIRDKSYKRKFKINPSVVIYQKSSKRWFIENLKENLGIGLIKLRNDGMIEYSIISKEEIKAFLTLIKPYLILKKPQAKLLLEIIELLKEVKTDNEFIEVCKLVDKFMILNDSKKRVNTAEIVKNSLVSPVET